MDMGTIGDIVTIVSEVIAACSVIVGGIAMITKITPTTGDDQIVGITQTVLHKVQRVLGMFALDSGAAAKNKS